MYKLKKCPFCGGEAKLSEHSKSDGDFYYNAAHIVCTKCLVKTPDFVTDGTYGETTTVQDVVDLWNNRV